MKFIPGCRLLLTLSVAGLLLGLGEAGVPSEVELKTVPSLKTPRLPQLKREIAAPSFLIAHLPMKGSAADVSGQGNHGTVHGASLVEDRFGAPNCAYRFDGSNDYIELANEHRFDLSNFTIAMHIKTIGLPTSPSPMSAGAYTLISKGENAGNFAVRLVRWGGASYCNLSYAQRTAGGTWSSGGAGRIYLNQFHHVAVTAEGGVLRLYVDGQQELEKVEVKPRLLNDTPVLIGRSPGDVAPKWFNGVIDDVRIYNRALAAPEIAQLASAGEE